MKCLHCKGEMVRQTAPFHIDRNCLHLSLDAVPAWVCKQCGEPYFEGAAVDSIQAILRAIDEEAEKLAKSA
ncbi:MAG: YgiT-type zinc finger protein [Acidobacteriota bacterium]